MPLDEFIIRVYGEIYETYAVVARTPLRRRGFAPALSDQEVLEADVGMAPLGWLDQELAEHG